MQDPKSLHVRVNCAACRREAPASILRPAQSELDGETRQLCPACIEFRAEALPAVITTINKIGWKTLSRDVRRIISVWDADGYVTIPEWAKRMSRRQLIIVVQDKSEPDPPTEEEDEAILERLHEKRRELRKAENQARVSGANPTRLGKRVKRVKTALSRRSKAKADEATG